MITDIGADAARLTGKFALLVDLGIITVPDDYVHAKRLHLFYKRNRKKFNYYNKGITDANFPNPSRILKPGDKLWVRVFKQIVPGKTTAEEHMAFLATQKAVHTGAQGLSLVWEQKRNRYQLPRGYWYASFDEKERLWKDAVWKDADRGPGVPGVSADEGGGYFPGGLDAYWDAFRFSLHPFDGVWGNALNFLCFCDESSGT